MKEKMLPKKELIVTLSENDYHYGVAALVNSLSAAGFSGKILVGYKGSLPTWTIDINDSYNSNTFYILPSIAIEFVKINTDIHFGYYKPFFLKDALKNHPQCEAFYYFDPDIVVNVNWTFFQYWHSCGICLCLDDSYPFVHSGHPWRHHWRELNNGFYPHKNPVDFYVNSGFIGLTHSNKDLLDKWIYFINRYRETGGNTNLFEKSGHRAVKGDQDLLNAAITFSPEIEYSVIGREGMGFAMPAYLMTHAIGENLKPWHTNFLLQLLKIGRRPTLAENNFFRYCKQPIQVFTKWQLTKKKLNLKAASILGRLIGL